MKKFLMIFILVLIPSILFSEDESRITTFFPNPNPSPQDKLEIKINKEKNVIKNSRHMLGLLPYVAVREGDLSLCPTEECKNKAKSLLEIRYLGEGRCDEIKDKTTQELCRALKSNDCNRLSGWLADYCKAMINQDVNLMVRIVNKNVSARDRLDKDKQSRFLGIYLGYRYYSPLPCERYLKNANLPLADQICCRLLLSPDIDKEMDNILRDLALFELSRTERKSDLCNLIKNPSIKRACTEYPGKTLRDILH